MNWNRRPSRSRRLPAAPTAAWASRSSKRATSAASTSCASPRGSRPAPRPPAFHRAIEELRLAVKLSQEKENLSHIDLGDALWASGDPIGAMTECTHAVEHGSKLGLERRASLSLALALRRLVTA